MFSKKKFILGLYTSIALSVALSDFVFAAESAAEKKTLDENVGVLEVNQDGIIDLNIPTEHFEADIIEHEVIDNPLVTQEEEHGRLFTSPYDPTHYLYPVKILVINQWQVPVNIFESKLRLSEGEYQITVLPDFSNIELQKVFMENVWEEKKVIFSIKNGQNIVVSARLLERENLLWEVQVYEINQPLQVDSEEINDTMQSN